MLRFILVSFAVLCSSILFAQKDDSQYQTIFNGETHYSGMGGFQFHVSSLGGRLAIGSGGGGGVILNRSLFIGGYGVSNYIDRKVLVNDQNNVNVSYDEVELNHGGIWAGYIFKGSASIHPVASVQAGFGSISYGDNNNTFSDAVFVVNPKIEVEMNVTRFFKIAVGGQYTLTNGVTRNNYSNNDFSGPGGTVSFRFGWFQ